MVSCGAGRGGVGLVNCFRTPAYSHSASPRPNATAALFELSDELTFCSRKYRVDAYEHRQHLSIVNGNDGDKVYSLESKYYRVIELTSCKLK